MTALPSILRSVLWLGRQRGRECSPALAICPRSSSLTHCQAALGRASAILKSQRAPKQPRQHKPRGKKLVAAKAAHAKAAAASEE